MPEAHRGVEERDDRAGGQLQQLEGGLVREAFERAAPEVDDPFVARRSQPRVLLAGGQQPFGGRRETLDQAFRAATVPGRARPRGAST